MGTSSHGRHKGPSKMAWTCLSDKVLGALQGGSTEHSQSLSAPPCRHPKNPRLSVTWLQQQRSKAAKCSSGCDMMRTSNLSGRDSFRQTLCCSGKPNQGKNTDFASRFMKMVCFSESGVLFQERSRRIHEKKTRFVKITDLCEFSLSVLG